MEMTSSKKKRSYRSLKRSKKSRSPRSYKYNRKNNLLSRGKKVSLKKGKSRSRKRYSSSRSRKRYSSSVPKNRKFKSKSPRKLVVISVFQFKKKSPDDFQNVRRNFKSWRRS